MSNQSRRDLKDPDNMAPNQPAVYGYHDARSQRPTAGRSGGPSTQQVPSTTQAFGTSHWTDPALAAQYYGYVPPTPQVLFSNHNLYQNMQSLRPASFGNPSYQAPVDPAAQMLQNWSMAQSGYGYPGQQYPVQHAAMQHAPFQQNAFEQTPIHHTPAQVQTDIKEDLKTVDVYSGDYVDSNMEDDPSAQLMAELNQDIPETARSPTLPAHQPFEAGDHKHQGVSQGWGNTLAAGTEFGLSDSMFPAPQNPHNAEYETFRSFENEHSISEAEKIQESQLKQQVDQVVAGLNDEDMQNVDCEEQNVIRRTPDSIDANVSADQDKDVDVDSEDHVEDSATERDVSTPFNDMEQREKSVSEASEDPSHVSETDVDEDDVMQDDPPQDYDIDSNDAQDEISDHGTEVETSDTEDTMEGDVVEDENTDADVSDAASSAAQEAHDSGVENSDVEDSPQVEFEGYMLTESRLKTIKTHIVEKRDKELHHKAFKLQPHILPAHRYWVAILMHKVQPQKAKVEKDFVWLKGSRINTVETMWNKYREVTTEEQHQLLFCGRVPDFTDTLEELDRFGDKLIVFRAAKQEVIVID